MDYGTCLWDVDCEVVSSISLVEELPFSQETRHQIRQFLEEYDQNYDWGCPPSAGWTVEQCKRFNREYKRVLNLIIPELKDQFLICIEQFDLIEDSELLAEFYRIGRGFVEDRVINYYHWSDDIR